MSKAHCFICSTHLEQQWPEGTNSDPDYDPWEDVKDGISLRLSAGYGSGNDGDYGYIVICDPCYTARKSNVVNLRNWIVESVEGIDSADLETIDPA